MEQEKSKYEDFIQDWEVDKKKGFATHNTGLTIGFFSANSKNIIKHYEHYLPWRRGLYASGYSSDQIDDQARLLSTQFDEICLKEFCTPERAFSFKEDDKSSATGLKTKDLIGKHMPRALSKKAESEKPEKSRNNLNTYYYVYENNKS